MNYFYVTTYTRMQIITHEDDNKKGRFFIKEGDKMLAEMTYKWRPNNEIDIDHTQVDDQLKGQGIGGKLLTEAVQWARDKNIKIYPTCPFVKSEFAKKAEYQDVFSTSFKKA